jgi:ATP-dependent protease ClpP protease subunit
MIIIPIDGVIGWDVTGRDIRRELDAADGADIRAEISTVGGSVLEGMLICSLLKNYSGQVHTHIMSHAASMGSRIALSGDRITAEPDAIFMIHNVRGFADGDHRELRARSDVFEGLTRLLAQTYADRAGMSVKEVRALMDSEKFYFGAEMKDAGFVDEIVGDGATAKDDAIALAMAAVVHCNAKMAERIEDHLEIAAMLKVETATGPQGNSDIKTPLNSGGKSNQEVVVMDLQKLKAEYPALYAQVLQEGREAGLAQARDSAKGHMVMAKKTGATDFALACIAEGKSLTDQEVVAEYLTAGITKGEIDARDEDNTEGDITDTDDTDADAVEAKLLDDVMALSTKSGAAVAPGKEV